MGCGSTKISQADGPTKKTSASAKNISKPTISLFFDPLTTFKMIQIGKIQAKVAMTSGESESQQAPIISSRLYSTDHFLTIIISQLKNFPLTEGKIYPKISYNLKEKMNAAVNIASNEDYHSFSTTGTDLSNPEIKIVLPLHDVKPKCLMLINLSIKEVKSLSNEEIKASFVFQIDPNLSRSPGKNESAVPFQGFEGFSLNGLSVPSLTVLRDQEEIKEPYIIEYGKSLSVRLNGMQGLKKTGEYVCPGCSLLALNDEGEEIFFQENLFPEDNEYHEEDLSDFTVKIGVGGDNFKPLRDFWLNVRVWDNKGDGQLGIKVRYQGAGKMKERANVYEVKQGSAQGEFEVKLKGETGLLKNKFVFIKTKKEFADIFSANLEKPVQVELEYDEEFKENKTNILEVSNSNDGIEKKIIAWRLVSVIAPH